MLLIPLIGEGSEAQKGQRTLFRHIKRTSQSLKPQFYKKKKSEFKPQFYLNSKPMFFPLTLQPLVKATQVQVFLTVLCSKFPFTFQRAGSIMLGRTGYADAYLG